MRKDLQRNSGVRTSPAITKETSDIFQQVITKEAHVLGLGPTLQNFIDLKLPKRDIITIGVNDIWDRYHPDYLFVADDVAGVKNQSIDRFKVILNSKPRTLFGMEDDHSWSIHPRYEHVYHTEIGRNYLGTWNQWDQMPYTWTCAFTAAVIAYHLLMRWKFCQNPQNQYHLKIILWGVDLRNHYYLCLPENEYMINEILMCFEGLRYKFAHIQDNNLPEHHNCKITLYRGYDPDDKSILSDIPELEEWEDERGMNFDSDC